MALECIVDHNVILICLASSQDTSEPQAHPTGSSILFRIRGWMAGVLPIMPISEIRLCNKMCNIKISNCFNLLVIFNMLSLWTLNVNKPNHFLMKTGNGYFF